MDDDLNIKKPIDPTLIKVGQSWEVNYWCKEFGWSKEELEKAVRIVGTFTDDVRDWIKKNKRW